MVKCTQANTKTILAYLYTIGYNNFMNRSSAVIFVTSVALTGAYLGLRGTSAKEIQPAWDADIPSVARAGIIVSCDSAITENGLPPEAKLPCYEGLVKVFNANGKTFAGKSTYNGAEMTLAAAMTAAQNMGPLIPTSISTAEVIRDISNRLNTELAAAGQ